MCLLFEKAFINSWQHMINEVFRPGQVGNLQQKVTCGSVPVLSCLTCSQLGPMSLDKDPHATQNG